MHLGCDRMISHAHLECGRASRCSKACWLPNVARLWLWLLVRPDSTLACHINYSRPVSLKMLRDILQCITEIHWFLNIILFRWMNGWMDILISCFFYPHLSMMPSHQHLKSTVRLPSLPGARVGPGTYQEDDCILQRSRPDRKVHRGPRSCRWGWSPQRASVGVDGMKPWLIMVNNG